MIVGRFDGRRLALEDAYRFPNAPVRVGATLQWDALRLWGDIEAGLRKAGAAGPVTSVGVDTWGVDFGLIDERGRLISNPVHYRDERTKGMVERAAGIVPRSQIYATTGIQFMEPNTIYQLLSMVASGDPQLRQADRLLMMADLFAHFLAGSTVAEDTLASTSQALDVRSRDWARPMLERLGIPSRILPKVVPPGTDVGPVIGELAQAQGLTGTRVVLPASHDTASAVVATQLETPATAYLSSGTWSLIGLETPGPVLSDAALAANLTNEGGVGGTIRLLRNVVGLWLVQESRRALWPQGDGPSYEVLAAMAEAAPSSSAFVDPDDERFLRPGDLPTRVRAFCAETTQPIPSDTGTLMRVLLESLALRYADALDQLSAATGQSIDALQIVGGGSQHRLLCRLTAQATGRTVRAGPVEATALGNLAVQAIAAGEVASVAEARQLIADSFPVATYEPSGGLAEARSRFASITHHGASRP